VNYRDGGAICKIGPMIQFLSAFMRNDFRVLVNLRRYRCLRRYGCLRSLVGIYMGSRTSLVSYPEAPGIFPPRGPGVLRNLTTRSMSMPMFLWVWGEEMEV